MSEPDVRAAVGVIALAAAEGWIATEPPVDVEARTESLLADSRGDGPDALFALLDGDRTVGCAGLHSKAPGVAYLGMAVLPGQRRRGGGRALLRALVEHARAAGVERLELEVFDDNAGAIGLYEKAGFAHEGKGADYARRDGSSRSSLRMSMRLSA